MSLQLRASRSSILALEACVAVPFGICLAAAIRRPGMWPAAGLCAAAAVFVLLWLAAFRLDVNADRITYTTLLAGARTIALQDVASAQIEGGAGRLADVWKPPIRLVIRPKPGTSARPLHINLKVFARPQIRQLVDFLHTRVNARVSSAEPA